MTGFPWRVIVLGLTAASVVVARAGAAGETHALALKATVAAASSDPLTITVQRWATDAERAPLLTALTAAAAPAQTPATDASARAGGAGGARAGRGGAGRGDGSAAGRGARGRGGSGGAAAASPLARFTTAVKAAPTLGYVWGSVTGYSIKYAWHSADVGKRRIVLVTERRIDAAPRLAPTTAPADAEADFSVIEIRFTGAGVGEGRTAAASDITVDQQAGTLALKDYTAASPLFRINR